MADNTSSNAVPATMKAWVFNGVAGGIEKNMKLVPDHPVPASFRHLTGKDDILVRVLVASVNPVDYKIAELPVVGGLVPKRPATPAADFCGRVVAATAPGFEVGALVAGSAAPMEQHGALAEYMLLHSSGCVVVPEGVAPEQAATVGIVGLTAWMTLQPFIQKIKKPEATTSPLRVFINGGSGGVGSMAVQIAKALGCEVTTACSQRNADFCRSLGADEVIEYDQTSVADALAATATATPAKLFDHAVDTVGASFALYKTSDRFLAPGASFVQIALNGMGDFLWINLLPACLGGAPRAHPFVMRHDDPAGMRQVLDLMAEGKVKVPVEAIPFAEAPRAYTQLKTHRTRGKLVVKVAEK